MRITNKMISDNYLTDMRNNLSNLQTIQKQMSTQKQINKASDDPTKAARIMDLNTNINANVQFNSNIKDANSFLDTTDVALGQAGDVLGRIRDLLVSTGNGGFTQQEKNAVKDEVNSKIGELSQILNTNFDGKYIFGGTRVDVKPINTINTSVSTVGTVVNTKFDGFPGSTVATVSKASVASGPTVDTIYKSTYDATSTPPGLTYQTSIDGGVTFSNPPAAAVVTAVGVTDYDCTLSDGLTVRINNDVTNKTGDTFTFAAKAGNTLNNTKLVYNSGDVNAVELVGSSDLTKNIGNSPINQINSNLSVEISKGVNVDYSVSATKALQFKNGSGTNVDLRQVLSNIVNHLDSKTGDGASNDPDSTTKLNTQDLQDITDVVSNLLSLRSVVGSNQNRMDAASSRNVTENANLTDILSKTQDVDITQKTIDLATSQTVYTAALQTSARIIQPSLLDYLK